MELEEREAVSKLAYLSSWKNQHFAREMGDIAISILTVAEAEDVRRSLRDATLHLHQRLPLALKMRQLATRISALHHVAVMIVLISLMKMG